MRRLLLLLLFTLTLFGERIELYRSNIIFVDNSKVSVEESINYNFEHVRHHGIYRDIPKNNTKLKNLRIYQNNSLVKHKLTNNRDFWRIRIGDPRYYVGGLINYTLKYNLEGMIVRDTKDKNFFAFDLVGTGWKKPIKEAIGRVYLPKEIQGRVTIKAFKGSFGSTVKAKYIDYGKYIETKAYNLAPGEGLTLYIEFDKSLMSVSKKLSNKYYMQPIYYLFLAPIFTLFYFIAKRFHLFSNIGSIAPKYRPLKDLTIMEAGLLKDNFVDFEEIKPAILELANLGYLKIEEDSEGLFLVKVKQSDNYLSSEQKLVFNEIFSYSDVIPSSKLKLHSSLFERLKETLHTSIVDKGYFSKSIKNSREGFTFAAFGLGALTLSAFAYYIFKDSGVDILIPTAVALVFVLLGIVNLANAFRTKEYSGILFNIIWVLFSSVFLLSALGNKDIAISLLLMVAIIAVGSYLIYRRMNTLTIRGELAKRHLLGLKEFIDKADKDKIKYFLQEDKRYLDKMLPYALLFGLNKHWLELYEELDTPTPEWYDGSFSNFTSIDFEPTSWSDSYATDSISSSPSIDIGEFESFGDFGGGGFGGGGGDSW